MSGDSGGGTGGQGEVVGNLLFLTDQIYETIDVQYIMVSLATCDFLDMSGFKEL